MAYFEQSEIYVFDDALRTRIRSFASCSIENFCPTLKQLGKTMLVVTHDERYFHLADKLVMFESGAIVSVVRNTAPYLQPCAAEALVSI